MKRHRNRWLAVVCLVVSSTTSLSWAKQVALDVSLAQPTLMADKKQTTFLKIGLTGFRLEQESERAPINVAIVLDKSGSMSGEKIEKAKEAAISAINRLRPSDIVSVVTYDTNVTVVVPATKLTDRESVVAKIREVSANGSTALFAGVSKGAEELRKFLEKERVNRVILLSDGLANVGPQSPSELGELGKSLAKECISVSTIGLGLDYNEDLMTRLASESDGNHVFVEQSTELVEVFNREFDEVMSVVAQELVIKIHCGDQVRPVRVLNSDAEITGQDVYIKFNQLYSLQEKYVLLEIELPPQKDGATMPVADVSVSYTNMQTNTEDRLSSQIAASFSSLLEKISAATNSSVVELCVLQMACMDNQEATRLRDLGDLEGARRLLQQNADYLLENGQQLNSPLLKERAAINRSQAEIVDNEDEWKRGRKLMRAIQYFDSTQQSVEAAPSSSGNKR